MITMVLPFVQDWSAGDDTVPLRMLNVGANKGYEVASFLERYQPSRGVTRRRWYMGIRRIAADAKSGYLTWISRGACGDGRQSIREEKELLTSKDSVRHVEVHAVELMDTNAAIIRNITKELHVNDIVHVYQQAVSNGTSLVQIPSRAHLGSERGSICTHKCRKHKEVMSATLDDFVMMHNLAPLFHVIIDTEGWDALVLEGFRATLKRQQIGILEFEYHTYGYWDTKNPEARSLRNTVQWLKEEAGYSCFFQASDNLIPISPPCWADEFEIRRWSNVLCLQARTIS